jgi:hypothetical protein
MQDRGNRQVFTPNRPIDNYLQALDGCEGINSAPIATSTVMIEH